LAVGGTFPVDTDTNDADQPVDALLSGKVWLPNSSGEYILTYSFTDSTTDYAIEGPADFFQVAPDVMNAVRVAFQMYSAITGISFVEITGPQDYDADIRIGGDRQTPSGISAYAEYPKGETESGGDIFFGPNFETPSLSYMLAGAYAERKFLRYRQFRLHHFRWQWWGVNGECCRDRLLHQ
jgi:hypothetical protein